MPVAYFFEAARQICYAGTDSRIIVSDVPRPMLEEETPTRPNLVFSYHYRVTRAVRFELTPEEFATYDKVTLPPGGLQLITVVSDNSIEVRDKDTEEVLHRLGRRVFPNTCEPFETEVRRITVCKDPSCKCLWAEKQEAFLTQEKAKADAWEKPTKQK